MRKIILDLAVTLDGFIEGPNGEIDWCTMDEEEDDGSHDFIDFINSIDTIFYGRTSYEMWGHYQPEEKDGKALYEVYQMIKKKAKYVFSTSKNGDEGDAIYINENIRETVQQLKEQPGKNIWLYGGGKLITSFVNMDLVDVYRLAVHPVILGSGKPLFQDIHQQHKLSLVSAKTSASGLVLLTYNTTR